MNTVIIHKKEENGLREDSLKEMIIALTWYNRTAGDDNETKITNEKEIGREKKKTKNK